MASITLHGNALNTCGELPANGTDAPAITLTNTDLGVFNWPSDGKGKAILNIFPSLDTPVCATTVRKFNEEAAALDDVSVLCISMDLPFALGRFCGAEGLDNVTPLSAFRNPEFGEDFGLTIIDGPMAGLLARAVVVIDEQNKIRYSQLVPEIAEEPDYQAALDAARA